MTLGIAHPSPLHRCFPRRQLLRRFLTGHRIRRGPRRRHQKTQAEKPKFAKRQQDLLAERYDLADRPAKGVTMSRGKPVQEGVRVKLPAGHDLGQARRHDARRDQGQEPLAGRVLPAAAPAPRSGRHDLPEAPDRRDEEADRPRPHALRPRLRPAASTCCPSFPRRSS